MMRRSAREDPGDTSEPAARGAAESPARDSAGSRERGSVESPERGSDRSREQGSAGRRAQGSEPYGWAALASAGVFLLYVVTLAPTTAFWDTSEYIATAHILGIPHPPGNPLFVVLARAWEAFLAPLGLSVAVRVNLFSAFVSAAAHGLWFLVAFRILTFFSENRRFALIGSAAAVLVSATTFTVWNQSNVNEKVYTVSLLTVALLSWLAFHWRGNLGRGKDDNLLVLMVFILALSVGNHLMAFLAAPALAVFILRVHPQTLINYRLYLAAGLAGLAGLSIHLFLPLRAALDPIISEADPTCETLGAALTSIVTWGQAGCAELSAALGRQQYDKPALVPRLAPLWSQIVNYLQYFDWQWSRSLSGDEVLFSRARGPFTVLFSGLGLFGAIEHFRRDRKSFWYVFMLFATLSAGLLFYLNFKYGYSIPAPIANRDLHEVRERDYFFIVGFSIWGLWAGIGIAAAWIWLAERFRVGLVRVAPVLGLALLPLALNWSWATRAHDYSARDWAYNLLQSIEPYGILFTNGDNDTFPLWYLQEVEGIRRDVTVMVTSYLNTDWYIRQIRDLTRPCPSGVDPGATPSRIVCQRPYDPQGLPAVYTHEPDEARAAGQVAIELSAPVSVPLRSIFDLPDETIATVARSPFVLPEDRSYRLGNVTAAIGAGEIFLPWQQFALSAIDSAIAERPVYFASTTNAQASLGLGDYLVREGLAYRLYNGDPATADTAGVVPLPPSPLAPVLGNYLDQRRTRTLVNDVFVHRGGIPHEWAFWPDRPTLGIPNYYAWVHYALAQAAGGEDDQEFEVHRAAGDEWARLGR